VVADYLFGAVTPTAPDVLAPFPFKVQLLEHQLAEW
jgi:hypothetical protein